MTDVTRTYYVNKINTLRPYSAGRTPPVSGTDVNRSAAWNGSVVDQPNDLPVANQADIDGSTDPTALPVEAVDVRNLVQARALTWSYVRRVKYYLQGNVSPAGATYIKYAWVKSPVQSSSVPGVGNAMFDSLSSGEDIDLSDFNVIIASLNSLIKADVDDLYGTTIQYCHSSCHSSCHNSRGRR